MSHRDPYVKFDRHGTAYVEVKELLAQPEVKRHYEEARQLMQRQADRSHARGASAASPARRTR